MEWLLILHLTFLSDSGMNVEVRTTQTAGTQLDCQRIANFLNAFEYAETRERNAIVTAKAYCTPALST